MTVKLVRLSADSAQLPLAIEPATDPGYNCFGPWPDDPPPVPLPPGMRPVSVGVGAAHICVSDADASVSCWGGNLFRELGTTIDAGPGIDALNAVRPTNVGAARKVLVIASTSCALMGSGGMKCWGDNGSGQVGAGSVNGKLLPIDVLLDASVQTAALGAGHACAISADRVYCWGANSFCQVTTDPDGGVGPLSHLYPVPVRGL